jgi:hypothetical protein
MESKITVHPLAASGKAKWTLSAFGIACLVATVLVAAPVKVDFSSAALSTNTADAGRQRP